MNFANQEPRSFDCHMHTPLCGHSFGEPEEYVDAAARRGIELLCFTCHIPMSVEGFGQEGTRMAMDELPLYRDKIAAAAAYGRERGVEVLCGIEAEIFPEEEPLEEMTTFLERESFDFVLGSLHHMLPLFRHWLYRNGHRDDRAIVAAYFRTLAGAAATGRYDSIAHPDVIRLYGTLGEPFDPAAHEEVIKEALDGIAETGVCLEINTSGRIKGDYIAHPDPLIMKWALERGIPFTLGSDSHTPERVGDGFREVLADARTLGLPALHYFRERRRHRLPFSPEMAGSGIA